MTCSLSLAFVFSGGSCLACHLCALCWGLTSEPFGCWTLLEHWMGGSLARQGCSIALYLLAGHLMFASCSHLLREPKVLSFLGDLPLLYKAPPKTTSASKMQIGTLQSVKWHPPTSDWQPPICSSCLELHTKSSLPNLHFGGCHFTFWRLKLPQDCEAFAMLGLLLVALLSVFCSYLEYTRPGLPVWRMALCALRLQRIHHVRFGRSPAAPPPCSGGSFPQATALPLLADKNLSSTELECEKAHRSLPPDHSPSTG